MVAPVTFKHLYGWRVEQILRPLLENIYGPLTPTNWRFDGVDLVGEKVLIEIKARPERNVKYGFIQTKDTYAEWLVPTCKAKKYTEGKELLFIYYWAYNQEVFCCKYTPEDFMGVRQEVPSWSKQEHFFIPSEKFSLILAGVSDK